LDGDRELRREAVPGGQCKPGSRAGAPPIVTAWSVCGTAGHGRTAAATDTGRPVPHPQRAPHHPRDVLILPGPARLRPDEQPAANGRRAAAHRRSQGRSPARNGPPRPLTADGSRQPAPRRAARHAPGFAARLPADRPAPAPARQVRDLKPSGTRAPGRRPQGNGGVGRLPPVHQSQRDHEPSLRWHTYPLFSMLEPSSPAPLVTLRVTFYGRRMTGSSVRPRSTSPSPWPQRSAEGGTASRMAGKRPCKAVNAITPSSRASRAPRQW
jgi:hypothetical protein